MMYRYLSFIKIFHLQNFFATSWVLFTFFMLSFEAQRWCPLKHKDSFFFFLAQRFLIFKSNLFFSFVYLCFWCDIKILTKMCNTEDGTFSVHFGGVAAFLHTTIIVLGRRKDIVDPTW